MKEEDYPIIDQSTSQDWIYPTNYPVRQYQLEICKKALFVNTLVCLPTGLGKTLIAAVIMYNYYRWFPTGKIIFMAPTRPLVNQQLQACCDIMSIPKEETVCLEGSISGERRSLLWQETRLIFCTPQTAVNDLAESRLNPKQIVCVVIDEAHKATANYAYTQFISVLSQFSQRFRVLGLSATPGADIKRIQQVISNLHISQIELRTEDDEEVAPYVYHKQIEIVPAGEIPKINTLLSPSQLQSISGLIEPEFSIDAIIEHELQYLSNDLLQQLHQFQLLPIPRLNKLNRYLYNQLARTVESKVEELSPQVYQRLVYCYEKLEEFILYQHVYNHDGIDVLYQTLIQQEKQNDFRYARVLDSLSKHLQDSHYFSKYLPKLFTLQHILLQHFAALNARDSRVLIFARLRQQVFSVKDILLQLKQSSIRPHEFIGQSNTSLGMVLSGSSRGSSKKLQGMSQQEQIQTLQDFRSGKYNVLIATSIAEEGLDIAEVDLLVFLDSIQSSIRLIQRIGRTGRKKAGRILQISDNCPKPKSPNMLNAGKENISAMDNNSNQKEIREEIMDLDENNLTEDENEVDEFADITDYGGSTKSALAMSKNNIASSGRKRNALNDEEKIIHSYETMKKLQNILLSRTHTLQFYRESDILPPNMMSPSAVQFLKMTNSTIDTQLSAIECVQSSGNSVNVNSSIFSVETNNTPKESFFSLTNVSNKIDDDEADLFRFDIVPTNCPEFETPTISEPPSSKKGVKSKLLNINNAKPSSFVQVCDSSKSSSSVFQNDNKQGSSKDTCSSLITSYFLPPRISPQLTTSAVKLDAAVNASLSSETVRERFSSTDQNIHQSSSSSRNISARNSFDTMLKNFEFDDGDDLSSLIKVTTPGPKNNSVALLSISNPSSTATTPTITCAISKSHEKVFVRKSSGHSTSTSFGKVNKSTDDFFSHLDDETLSSISTPIAKSETATIADLDLSVIPSVHDGNADYASISRSFLSNVNGNNNKKGIRSRLRNVVSSNRPTENFLSVVKPLHGMVDSISAADISALSIPTPLNLSLSAGYENKTETICVKTSEKKKKVRIAEKDDFFQLDDESELFPPLNENSINSNASLFNGMFRSHREEIEQVSNELLAKPSAEIDDNKNPGINFDQGAPAKNEVLNQSTNIAKVSTKPSIPPPKKMLLQKSGPDRKEPIILQPYEPQQSNLSANTQKSVLKSTASTISINAGFSSNHNVNNHQTIQVPQQKPIIENVVRPKSFLRKRCSPEKSSNQAVQHIVNENCSPNIRQSPIVYNATKSNRMSNKAMNYKSNSIEPSQYLNTNDTQESFEVDKSDPNKDSMNPLSVWHQPQLESGQCSICLQNGVFKCVKKSCDQSICTDESNGDDDGLIRCAGTCNSVVHPACYYGESIPDFTSQSFVCERCSSAIETNKVICCQLCFQSTGLLKKVPLSAGIQKQKEKSIDQFVHSLCVLFTPELYLDTYTMTCSNLHELPPERATLFCKQCKSRGGSIVQCAYEDCMNAYHIYCAYVSRSVPSVPLVIYETVKPSKSTCFSDDEDDGGEISHQLYCPQHSNRILSILKKRRANLLASANFDYKSKAMDSIDFEEESKDGKDGFDHKNKVPNKQIEYDDEEDLLLNVKAKPTTAFAAPKVKGRLQKASSKLQAEGDGCGDVFDDADVRKSDPKPKDKKDTLKKKSKLRKNFVGRFFDGEAAHSDREFTDASEDTTGRSKKRSEKSNVSSEGEDDDGDEDEVLSGDFINDGAYTQASPLTPTGTTIKSVARKFKKARSEKEFLRHQNLLSSSFTAGETPSTIDSRASREHNRQEETPEGGDEYALYLQMNRVYDEIYSPSPLIKKGRLHIQPHPDSVTPDTHADITPSKRSENWNDGSLSCVNLLDTSFATTATESSHSVVPKLTNNKSVYSNAKSKKNLQESEGEEEEWIETNRYHPKKTTKSTAKPAMSSFFDKTAAVMGEKQKSAASNKKRSLKENPDLRAQNECKKSCSVKNDRQKKYDSVYSEDEEDDDDDDYAELGSFIQDDDRTPSVHDSSSFDSQSTLDSDVDEFESNSAFGGKQYHELPSKKQSNHSANSGLKESSGGRKSFKRLKKRSHKIEERKFVSEQNHLSKKVVDIDNSFVDEDDEEASFPTVKRKEEKLTTRVEEKNKTEKFESATTGKSSVVSRLSTTKMKTNSTKTASTSSEIIVIDDSPEITTRKQNQDSGPLKNLPPVSTSLSSKQLDFQTKTLPFSTTNGSSSMRSVVHPSTVSTQSAKPISVLGMNKSISSISNTVLSKPPTNSGRPMSTDSLSRYLGEDTKSKANTVSVYDLLDDEEGTVLAPLPSSLIRTPHDNTTGKLPELNQYKANNAVDVERIQKTNRVFQQLCANLDDEDFILDYDFS